MNCPSYVNLLDHGEFVRMEGEDEIYSLQGKLYRAECHYVPSLGEERYFVVPYHGVPCMTSKPNNKQS
jgi:hypothetical protein